MTTPTPAHTPTVTDFIVAVRELDARATELRDEFTAAVFGGASKQEQARILFAERNVLWQLAGSAEGLVRAVTGEDR